ncbi:MAG: hypothetical protein ACOH2K_13485, partial [Burkholderiaceae bacterium]
WHATFFHKMCCTWNSSAPCLRENCISFESLLTLINLVQKSCAGECFMGAVQWEKLVATLIPTSVVFCIDHGDANPAAQVLLYFLNRARQATSVKRKRRGLDCQC